MSVDPIFHLSHDEVPAGLAGSAAAGTPPNAATADMRLVFDNLPDAYILLGHDYSIRLFNQKAKILLEAYIGLPVNEGDNVLSVAASAADYQRLLQVLPKIMTGRHETSEYRMPSPAGDKVLQVQYQPAFEGEKVKGCLLIIKDITESKKSETLVADNEQRWRFALEGSNQGVWDWNMQSGHTFYSESWYRMLGYQQGDIGSDITDWEEKIHPDDREAMRRHRVRHTTGSNPSYESEYRMQARDGSYRWILSRGMIMERLHDGQPSRMIGVHTDITERKGMEEKYKVLFYKNPQPMWTFDRQTLRFINVNEAATKLYGYTKEEFLAMTIGDICPAEELEGLYQDLKQNNGKDQALPQTWRHRKKNGSLIWVNISGFSFIEGGRTVTLVTAEDITQKTADREKLMASEKLYRQLFGNIPLPAYIYDRNTLQILEANHAACDHYGYTAAEFASLNLLELYPEEYREKISSAVAANKFKSGITISNRLHRKKDGTLINVEVWVSSVDLEGRPVRLVMVNDITEKLQAEAELRISNERYQYVLSATSDIVWDWRIGTDTVLWSDHYQHIMGWALPQSKQLPARHFMHCLHPDDKPRVLRGLLHLLVHTKEVLWENAFRYRRADGSYAYILDKGFVIRNKDGKALRMIGAMKDISEQQFQQEMQELELRIFTLASRPGMHIQSVLLDLAQGLDQLHKQVTTCVAWVSGADDVKIIAPKLAAAGAQWLSGFVKNRQHLWDESYVQASGIDSYQLPFNDASRISIWLGGTTAHHLISLPVFGTEGNLMAVLLLFLGGRREFTHIELNALHRMQNLLRILAIQHLSVAQIKQANERFDNVLKATHDAIWDWNLETGSFYRSPEGIRRVFGIQSENPIGNVHDWMGRIHPEDHAKVQQVITNILHAATENTFDVEYRFLRDDGAYTFLYDRGIIIRNADGKPVRMIGAAQDISERKRLEQELLQQELDRQKEISQATIDTQEQERAEIGKELHDNVNQILTTTKLYLDLAQSSPDMKDELLTKASKNVIHVINEIRQLSRSLMDPSIGDLGLVDSIKDLVENINLTRKITVKLQTDEALNNLLDDSRKLMIFRIVQEAMSNIIRHAQASTAHIKLVPGGKWVLLQITDNGVGFDPNDVKSGIGLKNIRNRVYLANGVLQIIAAPSKGCTLKIKFPLHKTPQ